MSSKLPTAEDQLLQKRRTGAKGTPILMHRSLWNLPLDRRTQYTILFLPLAFDLLLWFNLENITDFWAWIFAYWMQAMDMVGTVETLGQEMLWGVMDMPYPDLPALLPEQSAVWINMVACIIVMLLSNLIPSNFLPLTFLLRFILFIQLTASVYFLISPDYFPYTLGTYITQSLTLGIYLLLLTPPILSMIYYIFDVNFWYKVALTVLVLGYFIIMLPFQYLLHSLILGEVSMLFLPTLYIVFSFLFDSFIFVSLYAWAMTWPRNS
jgi:hypothetical protein